MTEPKEPEKQDTNIDKSNNIEQLKTNYFQVTTEQFHYYEQSGNTGIGHVSGGVFKEEAKVAGAMNEVRQQSLAFSPKDASAKSKSNQTSVSDNSSKSTLDLRQVVSEEHKYQGQLVLIEPAFCDELEVFEKRKLCIRLSIAFGEVEELYKYKEGLLFRDASEGYIRFGIKHGELYLNLQNGAMPLNQRGFREDPQEQWIVNATGSKEAPTWKFEAKGKPAVLSGSRDNQKLGNVDLSDTYCIVEAVFKLNINRNNLEITAQDGVWDTDTRATVKETKIRAFFKRVVEPKLKDYLSKVILRYDSTAIS